MTKVTNSYNVYLKGVSVIYGSNTQPSAKYGNYNFAFVINKRDKQTKEFAKTLMKCLNTAEVDETETQEILKRKIAVIDPDSQYYDEDAIYGDDTRLVWTSSKKPFALTYKQDLIVEEDFVPKGSLANVKVRVFFVENYKKLCVWPMAVYVYTAQADKAWENMNAETDLELQSTEPVEESVQKTKKESVKKKKPVIHKNMYKPTPAAMRKKDTKQDSPGESMQVPKDSVVEKVTETKFEW